MESAQLVYLLNCTLIESARIPLSQLGSMSSLKLPLRAMVESALPFFESARVIVFAKTYFCAMIESTLHSIELTRVYTFRKTYNLEPRVHCLILWSTRPL